MIKAPEDSGSGVGPLPGSVFLLCPLMEGGDKGALRGLFYGHSSHSWLHPRDLIPS